MAIHINEKDVISEYKRKIELREGLVEVGKECRESYYYLRSVEYWLSDNVVIIGKTDVKELEEVRKVVSSVKKEFEKLDKELLDGIDNNNEINSETLPEIVADKIDEDAQSDLSYIESTDIPNYIIQCVKLKSKIDKIQLTSIAFLIKMRDKINEETINENEKLRNIQSQYQVGIMADIAFNHSHEEDKIVTYEIYCKDSKLCSDFRKHNIKLPIFFSAKDYTYILNTHRGILNKKYELTMKLIELSIRISEEEQLKEMNKKQYSFNKQVVILTYVITFLTVITLIIGVVSLKYVIDDHSNKEKIWNNESNPKANANTSINNEDRKPDKLYLNLGSK